MGVFFIVFAILGRFRECRYSRGVALLATVMAVLEWTTALRWDLDSFCIECRYRMSWIWLYLGGSKPSYVFFCWCGALQITVLGANGCDFSFSFSFVFFSFIFMVVNGYFRQDVQLLLNF